jgi:DNA primase
MQLVFKEIKQTPICDILQWYKIELTPKGSDLIGVCPLCGGNGFKVSARKNVFNCFSCKQGGDVITFVSKKEGITLREAARRIQSMAQEHGTQSHEEALQAVQPVSPLPLPTPAIPEAAKPLRFNPPLTIALTLDPARTPYAEATARYFEAGYCGRGLHRGRVALPIHNARGELVAYVGRGEDGDKYPKNYMRGLEVYNLHRGKGKIVILVEDIYHVWELYEHGRHTAVALLGREVSPEQILALQESGVKAIDLRIREMGIVAELIPHFYVKLTA